MEDDMVRACSVVLENLTARRNAVQGAIDYISTLVNPPKNLAAVTLGHLGGIKGGPARSASLSAKRRSKIASMAAKARWSKGGDA